VSASVGADSFTSGETIEGTLGFGHDGKQTTYGFRVPVSEADGSKCAP
jgi:hypothetical protein